MIKRILFSALCLIAFTLQTHAVLKEDSLANTLSILRQELVTYHDDYSANLQNTSNSNQRVFNILMDAMQKSNQNALMLYSQRSGYVFDQTYACHEAIEQYQDFKRHIIPFREYVDKSSDEVDRFDSLIVTLKAMPIQLLNDKAKEDRNVCLALAVNIRRMLVETSNQLKEYIYYYEMTESRLKNLNDYANKRYDEIQNSIFVNGGESYFTILSRFGYYFSQTKQSVKGKYAVNKKIRSQWDSRLIFGLFGVILIYGLIAILLNQLLVRWLVTRLVRNGKLQSIADFFLEKRNFIIMASTVVTFAIILGIVAMLTTQNFIIMASKLLVEYAWLLSVIVISLLIRVNAGQMLNTFRIYAPLLANGFIVISFRIILIPNDLVNLIFPLILLICCLWQWSVLHRYSKKVERSDMIYAYISQTVFVASTVCAIIGYTLLSVQILIWWIMQLTGILTITCISDWYLEYAKLKHIEEQPITKRWIHSFFYLVLLPTAAVFSVVISLYSAADVFNLSDLTFKLFSDKFIDTPNFSASILSIMIVVVLFFFFNFLNKTLKAMAYYYFERQDPTTASSRIVMVKNVLQVIVWGIWLLISMGILHVGNSWIIAISAGLSTGVGFASKDILENIYYGISLMAGRIRIGDLIVCDGIRGRVTSISYTSTMITATDGSVIAFTNSQLFTKNYKNMTHNHGEELRVLNVGVAYGSDIKQVRQLLHDAIMELDCVNREKGVNVVIKELGDNSVNLGVTCWINALTQFGDEGRIMECIYDTLNANGIEIPFPQRDVHLVQA